MFFDSTLTTGKRQVESLIPKCGACGLHTGCISPKMPVTGKGRLGILVVAEAPGKDEDERNEQLVGPAGQELRKALDKCGIDLDLDCWKTNSIICRPPQNRTPSTDEIDWCRPNLMKALQELNPRVIIPLGASAVRSVIGPIWREDPGPVTTWVGWRIPCQKYNTWIAPTYHPSYVHRSVDPKQGSREGAVVKLWFERHLASAAELKGRPFEVVPNYEKLIRVEQNPEAAAKWIEDKIKAGGAFAFDYETNCLKPEVPGAEIVCCSICWNGKETIAYPWVGSAIDATKKFLASPHPKIGANNKFETRWSRTILGVDVVNWQWDTMLSAHHLDNRDLITSVKFQAFVRLGVGDWGAAVRPYLQAENDWSLNRIRQVNLRTLLVYCGVDSRVEYELAVLQRKEMLGLCK